MDNAETNPRSDYYAYISERVSEIIKEDPNILKKNALSTAREEWNLKKLDKGKTIKKRGRPKKKLETEKKITSFKKRGRPHKDPLMNYVDAFEIFIKQFKPPFDKQEIMKQMQIDIDTLDIFLENIEPESQLNKLVKKKNEPKKNRGRPKGSKKKNVCENKIIPKKEKEQLVIDFELSFDAVLSEAEEEDDDDQGYKTPPTLTPRYNSSLSLDNVD